MIMLQFDGFSNGNHKYILWLYGVITYDKDRISFQYRNSIQRHIGNTSLIHILVEVQEDGFGKGANPETVAW